MTVLIVCTGNTCRSPMAAALLRHLAAQRGFPLNVLSAGTFAIPDQPATPEAQATLMGRGIDLGDHRSRPLTPELVASADRILTMTAAHKEQVLALDPGAAGKTYTLGEYAGTGEEVPDPFGRSAEAYREAADQMERLLQLALERLMKEVQGA
ncbi:MAG: low molecular weight protein arginine phosphatase [Firmicutes bacterium]|nr:low molecular weight protein arginine phosphatase [Bacillota bacterium]